MANGAHPYFYETNRERTILDENGNVVAQTRSSISVRMRPSSQGVNNYPFFNNTRPMVFHNNTEEFFDYRYNGEQQNFAANDATYYYPHYPNFSENLASYPIRVDNNGNQTAMLNSGGGGDDGQGILANRPIVANNNGYQTAMLINSGDDGRVILVNRPIVANNNGYQAMLSSDSAWSVGAREWYRNPVIASNYDNLIAMLMRDGVGGAQRILANRPITANNNANQMAMLNSACDCGSIFQDPPIISNNQIPMLTSGGGARAGGSGPGGNGRRLLEIEYPIMPNNNGNQTVARNGPIENWNNQLHPQLNGFVDTTNYDGQNFLDDSSRNGPIVNWNNQFHPQLSGFVDTTNFDGQNFSDDLSRSIDLFGAMSIHELQKPQ